MPAQYVLSYRLCEKHILNKSINIFEMLIKDVSESIMIVLSNYATISDQFNKIGGINDHTQVITKHNCEHSVTDLTELLKPNFEQT